MPENERLVREAAEDQPIKFIRAADVSVPLIDNPVIDESPEMVKLREAFFAGKDLKRDELERLVASGAEGGGGGNGNCNIC